MRVRESCPDFTWAQAIEWLRAQPDRQELVRQCYFDEPVELAAELGGGETLHAGRWFVAVRA